MTFSRRHATVLTLLALVAMTALIEPAAAQTANVEKVLQNIVDALTGNIAKLLATLAVIITGLAWMFGYLDLRRAGFVIMGVAILFGASEIVGTLDWQIADRLEPPSPSPKIIPCPTSASPRTPCFSHAPGPPWSSGSRWKRLA